MDASLVNTESIGTESKEHDTSSRSGNDAHTDDADIRPIYDEESNGFTKGTIDPTLFKIKYGKDILLVQIYVDDKKC
ncbi:hypothetical protein Tco_0876859 [Tanacetum coccineum]|uniref:Uncharacterized protein n=1 Tax=Tanacetum coccineum TaxID=301880 RepID=A0ABQ5BWY4_9ASTR